MASTSEHLSDRKIKTLPDPKKRKEYYDDHLIENGALKKKGVKGLALRVTPNGSKSFVYRYWYNGKTKRYTIGSYPDWSLTDAREKARELSKVVDSGKDPAFQKQVEKNREPITLSEYIEQFRNDYMKRKLKASTQKTYESRLNKVQADKISKLALKEIKRTDIRTFLKGEAKQYPTNANRLHSILSKVFNEAINDEVITKNPIKGMGKISKEKERDIHYTDENIKDIWSAICEEWEPMQSLLKMLMITGQRLGETSNMKWDDIHNNVWRIPKADTKNETAHEVPLPKMALNILKKLQPINGASEYVFASQRDKSKPLSHFGNVIDRIREVTMLNDFRIHDLRHIVATKMIELGIEFITVGKVLNHKGLSANNAITSRYINTDMTKQKTRAIEIYAGHLTELVSPLSLKKHG